MNDINTPKDIEFLVESFYNKLLTDNLVKHFFIEVVKIDLKAHLPTICNFWQATLFGKTAYSGNPMLKHIEMHKKSAIEAKHFERWLSHWKNTIDENFMGKNAELAKMRANQIASIMEYKTSKISE